MNAKNTRPFLARNVTQSKERDPWLGLAAAVVERAVNDAVGWQVGQHSPAAKAKMAAEARCWLQNGANGLLAEFGIDVEMLPARLRNGAQ